MSHCCLVVEVVDCDNVIREFDLKTFYYVHFFGSFVGVMINELDLQTYAGEFESYWVPLSYGFVSNLSKRKA